MTIQEFSSEHILRNGEWVLTKDNDHPSYDIIGNPWRAALNDCYVDLTDDGLDSLDKWIEETEQFLNLLKEIKRQSNGQ